MVNKTIIKGFIFVTSKKLNTAANNWFECYIVTSRIDGQHQMNVGDDWRLIMCM